MDDDILTSARQVIETASRLKIIIATAESCTGGLISGALTEISGSSAIFDRSFITYSNDAKHQMLGVPRDVLKRFGAVSEPVAKAMAAGALARSNATLTLAVTGIAGPTGGTPSKPIGTVWFGFANRDGIITADHQLFSNATRSKVRELTVAHGLKILLTEILLRGA